MRGGIAVLMAGVVLGVGAPTVMAQDRYAADDPCGDVGQLAGVAGRDLGVGAGDFFARHDLRQVQVAAPPGGGVEVLLRLCSGAKGFVALGGERAVTATSGACELTLRAAEPPAPADVGEVRPEPRLTGECAGRAFDVLLPKSALAIDGAEVRLIVHRRMPGLPPSVLASLRPGARWHDIYARAAPTILDELGVFVGDPRNPQLRLSPGGRPDYAGGDGVVVLRG